VESRVGDVGRDGGAVLTGGRAARRLPAAVRAFDAAAETFDRRFGEWASVAAQRRAVRRLLLAAFPPGASLLELGGGTGEDALFLAAHGRRVLLTDGAPRMVAEAAAKAQRAGQSDRVRTRTLLLEEIQDFAREWRAAGGGPFDGAYSNFAALNCVPDLAPIARGLAELLPSGAPAVLVLFGPLPPGEVIVQLVRRDVRAAFRRLARGPVPARLGGRDFQVWYPRPRDVVRAFAPWFRLRRRRGVGIFVPPSAAEPWISRHPRLLATLEALDRVAAAPLAWLGDHVAFWFERTAVPVANGRSLA
jgi:SAM-dependent methyltransferase